MIVVPIIALSKLVTQDLQSFLQSEFGCSIRLESDVFWLAALQGYPIVVTYSEVVNVYHCFQGDYKIFQSNLVPWFLYWEVLRR